MNKYISTSYVQARKENREEELRNRKSTFWDRVLRTAKRRCQKTCGCVCFKKKVLSTNSDHEQIMSSSLDDPVSPHALQKPNQSIVVAGSEDEENKQVSGYTPTSIHIYIHT